jgi:hypothetical protein
MKTTLHVRACCAVLTFALMGALSARAQNNTSTATNALSLSGASTSYVTVPSGTWFNGNFTIEGWVYPRSFNSWERLIDFSLGAPDDNVYFAISSGTSGNPTMGILTTGSTPTLQATNVLPLNQWSHIATTLNGTATSIYINGYLVASGTYAGGVPNVTRTLNYIGKSPFASDGYANANMDEVRIWNVARSQTQIQSNMLRNLVGNESGLIGYWRFDEGSGTIAHDSSPTGATATLQSGAGWQVPSTAPIGTNFALNFQGSLATDASISNNASFNTLPLTVMSWFMVPTNSPNDGGIVNRYGSQSYNGYQIGYSAQGQVFGWYYRSQTDFIGRTTAPGTYSDGLWHMAAMTVDTNGLRLYVDGTLQMTNSWSGPAGVCSTTSPLLLGVYPGDSSFTGSIDEASLWNVALTQTQIQTCMNRPLAGNETGLLAYYHLDEGSGTTVIDASGHGNNGTLTNFTWLYPGWTVSGVKFYSPPQATTLPATVNGNSATLQGAANPEGLASGTYFQWGTTTNYGNTTPAVAIGNGTSTVSNTALVSLPGSGVYHFQCVVTNVSYTNFGQDMSFDTDTNPPTVANLLAVNIGATNASLTASINANSQPTTAYFAYGTTTDLGTTNAVSAIGSVIVTNNITGLLANTLYYFAVLVSNVDGVAASGPASFMTTVYPPVLAGASVTNISSTSAVILTTANPEGSDTASFVNYGPTTAYGTTVSTDSGSGTNFVTASLTLTGLAPGTPYHYQVGASNAGGAVFGTDSIFQTLGPPVLTLQSPSGIHPAYVTLNASVNPSGAASTVWFQYGTTTNYGTISAPAIIPAGTTAVPISIPVGGLSASTTYYYQALGSNVSGSSASARSTFSTIAYGSTYTVTSLTDGVSGSLRVAISNANLATSDAIVDVSKLIGTILLTNSLPVITNGMLIQGSGSNSLTVSGNNAWRVFFIDVSNDSVILSNLSIVNGKATGGAGGGGGGGGAGMGGGLFVNNGVVTVAGVAFSNCAAVGGAGGPVSTLSGGGGGGGLGGAGASGGDNGNAEGAGGGGGGYQGAGGAAYGSDGAGGGGGMFGTGQAGNPGPENGGSGVGGAGGGLLPGIGGGGAGGALSQPGSPGGYGQGGGGGGTVETTEGDAGGAGGKFGGGGGSSEDPSGNNIASAGNGGDFGGGGGNAGGGNGGNPGQPQGGNGGFGGGGGSSGYYGGLGGTGGFGGGGGGATTPAEGGSVAYGGTGGVIGEGTGGGGGGAGLGGSIFVRSTNGASLNFVNSTTTAGTVTGGLPGTNVLAQFQGERNATVGAAAGSTFYLLGGTNTFTVSQGTQTIPGTISGWNSAPGIVAKTGSGTLVLSGTNDFPGNALVTGGVLEVDGMISSATTTASAGGTVDGAGTLAPLVCNNGGVIQPGRSNVIGTLTSGNNTWIGNGSYIWQLSNATGTAGTGYSLFNIKGTLNVSSAAGFTVNVSSVGTVQNFNPAGAYSWTIAQTTGGIVGFNASNFTAAALPPFNSVTVGGVFWVTLSGNNLILNYGPPPPAATTLAASSIFITQATFNGSVNPNGSASTAWFNYGLNTGYGNSTASIPLGSGTTPVLVTNMVTGLQQGTTYHCQIVASSANGTTTGNDATFTTLLPFSFTNITVQPGQTVLVQGNGSPGITYSVQESTNLPIWTPLTQITANTNGLFQFLATNSNSAPALFLRLSVP